MPIPHTFNPLGKYRDSELYWIEVQPGIVTETLEVKISASVASGQYFRIVDWGDGSEGESAQNGVYLTHTYSESGTYRILIKADCTYTTLGNASVVDVDPDLKKLGAIQSTNNMFNGCTNLFVLPDGFAIPETVSTCSNMFLGCSNLQYLPESLKLPEKTTACFQMFSGCASLTELPDGFTIPDRVTNVLTMFGSCVSLLKLPEQFKLSNIVTTTQNMFNKCTSLKEIPEDFYIPDSVINSGGMFFQCINLESDISNLFREFSSGNRSVAQMFDGCVNVTGTLPADKLWNNTGVTWAKTTLCFRNCSKLTNYSEIPSGWR